MKLSIIIVNYNVKYFLDQAIHSALIASQGLLTEIIVIDNNSTDGSVEFIQNKYPHIQVIANKKNVGFSAANNQGIAIAKGEFILLLNPDTVVAEDTFTLCLDFLDMHPQAGGLGVKMLDGTGKFLPESKRAFPSPEVAFYKAFGLSAMFPKSKIFGKYHLGFLSENETHEVEVLAGAFMMLRKTALEKTGMLDENFFMYGEDIDLSYRIVKAGYKNYYFPKTSIIHYKGESTKKGSLNYVRMFYNAMKIFARKHFSGGNAGAFIFLINIAIYFRALIAVCSRFTKKMAWPITDAVIIFISMFLIKEYWEYYVRYIEGGKYPNTYLIFNIPAYTIIWIAALFFSGVYDKGANTTRIIRGVFWGTLIIAALYGFLPESLRFSRGMIIAGAGVITMLLLATRFLFHFSRYGNFRFGLKKSKRIIIIGSELFFKHVNEILNPSFLSANIIGYINPDKVDSDKDSLGSITELPLLIKIYNPGEIIYSATETSYKRIIGLMENLNYIAEYKIGSVQSPVLLGSNSKDSAGDYFALENELNITNSHNRRSKRLFDFSTATLLFFSFPALLIFFKNKKQLLKNILDVLIGQKTWVSYAQSTENTMHLPIVNPGILNPFDIIDNKMVLDVSFEKINFLYAKDYSLSEDIRIFLRGFSQIDRKS